MQLANAIKTLDKILASLSIPLPIKSLTSIPSSLWIILFERIFSTKLNLPSHPTHASISTLLSTISSLLMINLDHITAQHLLDSNATACSNLIEIYNQLFDLLHHQDDQDGLSDVSSIARFDADSFDQSVSVDFIEGNAAGMKRGRENETVIVNKRARVDDVCEN
jgi:hypothetical protein